MLKYEKETIITDLFSYHKEECIFNVSPFDLDFFLKWLKHFKLMNKLLCLIVINIAVVING